MAGMFYLPMCPKTSTCEIANLKFIIPHHLFFHVQHHIILTAALWILCPFQIFANLCSNNKEITQENDLERGKWSFGWWLQWKTSRIGFGVVLSFAFPVLAAAQPASSTVPSSNQCLLKTAQAYKKPIAPMGDLILLGSYFCLCIVSWC